MPWGETDDPVALVAELLGAAPDAWPSATAPGPSSWSTCSGRRPAHRASARASEVIGPLRAVKDAARDRGAARGPPRPSTASPPSCRPGDIPLVGRTEAEVSADLGRRILAEGHHRVNFAIVAAGENAASPHHEPGDRVIAPGEVVLCDFGGTMLAEGGAGYCSDITRCVVTGEPPAEMAEVYAVLHEAQAAGGRRRPRSGTPCEAVDAAARDIITDAGYGEWFIHRTGHGIGVEEHEDPYIVDGQPPRRSSPATPSRSSPASTCPAASASASRTSSSPPTHGPDALNRADHRLVAVDA